MISLSTPQAHRSAPSLLTQETTRVDTFHARLGTPSDLAETDRAQIGMALLPWSADVLALFIKTKNYHWRVSGSHYKEYHELLDEHAAQVMRSVARQNFPRKRARAVTTAARISHGNVSVRWKSRITKNFVIRTGIDV